MAYLPQRYVGVGEYDPLNWTFEFYPPPYQFAAPVASVPPAPTLMNRGVGDCGCGGSCGGCGDHHHGIGFFDSMDFTTWGWPEWLTIAGGVYLAASLFSDTRRVAGSVRKYSRSRRSARRRRLQQELDSF